MTMTYDIRLRFRGLWLAKSAHNLSQERPMNPFIDLAKNIHSLLSYRALRYSKTEKLALRAQKRMKKKTGMGGRRNAVHDSEEPFSRYTLDLTHFRDNPNSG